MLNGRSVSGADTVDLLRFSILNRNHQSTVALVHGLFASEGYWLPYLKLLQDYRLLLVGVAYGSDQFEPHSVSAALSDICREENVKIMVGHSLGASLVRLTEVEVGKVLICDVGRAQRLLMPPFDQLIPNFGKTSHNEVKASLANATLLYDAVKNYVGGADITLTPSHDKYFSYFEKPNFNGTHFDIEDAMCHLLPILGELLVRTES